MQFSMKFRILSGLVAPFFLSPVLFAADNTQPEVSSEMEEMLVSGVRERLERAGVLSDSIMKTEVVGLSDIEDSNAANLSEAIANSPGVRVNNECSMCGVKRILLNGLRGEQTTILVDGLPSHTLISGFYAVDAIPATGVERIEVARGAGASLIAPEAIGGTVNIVSREAERNSAEIDLSAGENGFRKIGLFATGVSDSGATRATLVAQYDTREQFDADDNKVSESPLLTNSSAILRVLQDIGSHHNLTFRLARIESEIFGGPVLGEQFADGKMQSPDQVLAAFDDTGSTHLFEGNNVHNTYIGKAWETTEWVMTERDELALSWLWEISPDWNSTLSTSYAKHIQDSFFEGFDYFAVDEMLYTDARFNWLAGDDHFVTFGLDNREERLNSASKKGATSENYVSDSFTYRVTGLYVQDRYQVTDDFEVALALRVDDVEADFTDPSKKGTEISEVMVSPRIDMRYMHNDQWTSRLSGGRGYRAPLSFFESDHGILDADAGFEVDVNQLERSNSATYALSFEQEVVSVTASLAYTEVENLAALSETSDGVPLLTQLEDKATVLAGDIAIGWDVTDELTLDFLAETFVYNEAFEGAYAIAPTDKRLTFNLDWDVNGYDLFVNLVWYGSKDLRDYGYEGYTAYGDDGQTIEDSKKPLDAPSYFILNTKLSKSLTDELTVYVGANNLLDYTQTGEGDSPLMFDDSGAEGYDVAYIYGPLRGREAYAGLKWVF